RHLARYRLVEQVVEDEARIALERIAIAAADHDRIDDEASFRKRHALQWRQVGRHDLAPGRGRDHVDRVARLAKLRVEIGRVDAHLVTADTGRIAAEQAPAAGDPMIGGIVGGEILLAKYQDDALHTETTGIFAEAAGVDHVIAAEIHQRILHLDILDVGYADGGIVHVSPGRHAVAIGRRAEARAVHVVDALAHRVSVLV